MEKSIFKFIVIFLLFFILFTCFVILYKIERVHGGEYKTPSWQQRTINNYNYNQAVHGRESTTIENNKDAPSWQRRTIDNYNYDNAVHNKQKDKK